MLRYADIITACENCHDFTEKNNKEKKQTVTAMLLIKSWLLFLNLQVGVMFCATTFIVIKWYAYLLLTFEQIQQAVAKIFPNILEVNMTKIIQVIPKFIFTRSKYIYVIINLFSVIELKNYIIIILANAFTGCPDSTIIIMYTACFWKCYQMFIN